MASLQSNRQSSSAISGSSASNLRRSAPVLRATRPFDPLPEESIIPTASNTLIHQLPGEDLPAQHSSYFGNKVTLCFEEEFTMKEAREWVVSFNQRSNIPLTIVEAIPPALFVVLLDVVDPIAAKQKLLADSLLGAHEVFASVNEFSERPDPCNQRDVRHLVTVNIPQGTREIYRYISFVAALIGKFVKAKLDPGPVHQHISVVVESTLKLFPAQGFASTSSGESSLGISCQNPSASTPLATRRKRNRPRSGNRPTYLRHQTISREEEEISPIVVEEGARALAGVQFTEQRVDNVQVFYADDVAAVIKADMRYIEECHRILTLFGLASGLKFIWEKTKAAFIPEGPPPLRFWLLPRGHGRKTQTPLIIWVFLWLVTSPLLF